MADRHLGTIMNQLPEDAKIVVTSDHGMSAVSKKFYINELLRNNELLEFDCNGVIDLSRTKAFFHPCDNGAIFINTENYTDGIVPLSHKQQLMDKLLNILSIFNDKQTGKPVIRSIARICEQASLSRELWGDVFVQPSYGYSICADKNKTILEKNYKSGYHHFNADFSSMDGICFISDKSTEYIRDIYNTDIFSIICELLGIPLPHRDNERCASNV